jgi:hypothetical protein
MFDTHKLNDTGFEKMKTYKQTMADAVKTVTATMPEGRDKSIFITKVEEGIFFGAKAIASQPENHTEVTTY